MLLSDLLQEILEKTKYTDYLQEDDPEKYEDRLNNIKELSSMFIKYQEENEDFELSDFLEDVALVSDIDSYNDDEDSVVLMTMHSAKGLEFPVVFIPGMEEGIFPGSQAMYSEEELEEERRLAYVGITRAREKLYLVNARQRMLYWHHQPEYALPLFAGDPGAGDGGCDRSVLPQPRGLYRRQGGTADPKEQLRPQVRRRQDRQGRSGSYRRDLRRRRYGAPQDLWHRRGAVYPAHGQRYPFGGGL